MENFIIIAIVFGIVAAAIIYVIRAKKKGARCIGCPDAKRCGKEGSCGCTEKQ